jgi:hypothetical protein
MEQIFSHNVRFRLADPMAGSSDRPGMGIADSLRAYLLSMGVDAGDLDSWRDCGHSIGIGPFRPGRWQQRPTLEIALSQAGEKDLWIAQVSDQTTPDFISRLFGARATDHSNEILAMSRLIHDFLVTHGATDIGWLRNGDPLGAGATREP